MPGRPIWFELMTPDPDAVRDFYRAVVGWEIPPSGSPVGTGHMDYRMIQRSDGGMAGGVLKMSQDMIDHGGKPGWMTYFEVDDVPAAIAQIEQAGGKTFMPPQTMEVGTIAMVGDPQGAPFYVMNPTPPADRPNAKSDVWDAMADERCRWIELATTDAPAAREFYRDLLGWEFRDVMPMGPAGDYLFIRHGDEQLGAISPIMREGMPPFWLCYFGVHEASAAHVAALANGGTQVGDPHEVPGGLFVFTAVDPAGALVAFVGPKGA
ncbi:MAG: VOC family protein [Acetobacteraceae bacterium]|nr:VOC family protein [Acetobacteraceae bacterium]